MKPGLVSPDFFCLLSVSLSEITLAILVNLRSLFPTYFENPTSRYQFFFDSSNHQHGIRVSYDMILFNFAHIVKRDECRNRVNIGYS